MPIQFNLSLPSTGFGIADKILSYPLALLTASAGITALATTTLGMAAYAYKMGKKQAEVIRFTIAPDKDTANNEIVVKQYKFKDKSGCPRVLELWQRKVEMPQKHMPAFGAPLNHKTLYHPAAAAPIYIAGSHEEVKKMSGSYCADMNEGQVCFGQLLHDAHLTEPDFVSPTTEKLNAPVVCLDTPSGHAVCTEPQMISA